MIKTRKNWKFTFIAEPSWKKITASKLEEWKSYLQENLYCYRTILSIVEDIVIYRRSNRREERIESCSKSHFARKSPYEITKEEKELIDTKEEKELIDTYK
jgi:hypothetical protein